MSMRSILKKVCVHVCCIVCEMYLIKSHVIITLRLGEYLKYFRNVCYVIRHS